MPHATSPSPGVQALILCGPGENLLPFNSNPKDFPKALIPIANRPMVWYPLEWCHSMGISSIHLITPPDCSAALEAALSQNPYLTSLPSPRPTILAPEELTLTTGTAELLRLKQVQQAITGDFVVLACDLICEVPGTSLLDIWMTQHGTIQSGHAATSRQGALGVWYETKDASEGGVGVKKEETDFVASSKAMPPSAAPLPVDSLQSHVRQVRTAMPTGTLQDELEEKKALRVRSQLLRDQGNVKFHMSNRDSHIYFFPYWVKEFARLNDAFDSIGEDVLGWWAKSTWQRGLSTKLRLDEAMRPAKRRKSDPTVAASSLSDSFDFSALSSTVVNDLRINESTDADPKEPDFASRVSTANTSEAVPNQVPSVLGYMHPAHSIPAVSLDKQKQKQQPKPQPQGKQSSQQQQQSQEPTIEAPSALIRRVDTVPQLLSASLYLARLPAILEQVPAAARSKIPHPYAHTQQVHATTALPSQATIHTPTVLLDANIQLQPRITIRDSVVGANCSIASGARIHGCLLMDGVVVEEKAVLSGCVLGRRCRVGRECDLKDCFAQEGYVVAEGTKAKGDVLAGFTGGEEDGLMDDEDEAGGSGGGLDLNAM